MQARLWGEIGGISEDRGIRKLESLDKSASYRKVVALAAIFVIRPDAHYPKLPKSSQTQKRHLSRDGFGAVGGTGIVLAGSTPSRSGLGGFWTGAWGIFWPLM
jgi:hypothetical protein